MSSIARWRIGHIGKLHWWYIGGKARTLVVRWRQPIQRKDD